MVFYVSEFIANFMSDLNMNIQFAAVTSKKYSCKMPIMYYILPSRQAVDRSNSFVHVHESIPYNITTWSFNGFEIIVLWTWPKQCDELAHTQSGNDRD
jgi:hypothetical protein